MIFCLQTIKQAGNLCGINSTMNADKVINAAIEAYAGLRGITKAEVISAYETSEAVRNSIFLLICGGLAK